MPIGETVRSFREILDGKHDDLPEGVFLLKGSIDDVVAAAGKGDGKKDDDKGDEDEAEDETKAESEDDSDDESEDDADEKKDD